MGDVSSNETLVEYKGRKVYPEVVEYFQGERHRARIREDARTVAQRYWEDAERQMYREAEDQGRMFDRYDHASGDAGKWRTARDRYNELLQAGREQAEADRDLLLNSPHREVKWIAEHCLFAEQGSEVEGYAKNILEILPATVDEIWAEAKDRRGMCEVFDRFYEEAERAGIFHVNGQAPVGWKEQAAFRNYIRRNYGSTYMREMQPYVDRIVKAVQEAADARLEAAKAEWQGLDEAWRSERSRRAAQTRRERSRATEGANLGDVPEPVNLVHPERVGNTATGPIVSKVPAFQ